MSFPSGFCAASHMARVLLRNRVVASLPLCTAAQQQNAAGGSKRGDRFCPQITPLPALPAKPSSDAELIKILGRNLSISERICCEESKLYFAKSLGESTPFEIQDDTGESIVTLRRRYHGEDIEVTLGTKYSATRKEHDAMNFDIGGDSDDEGEDIEVTLGTEYSATWKKEHDAMNFAVGGDSDDECDSDDSDDEGDSDDAKCECENCEDEDCTCYCHSSSGETDKEYCHSSGGESDEEACLYRVPLTVRVRKGERSPSLEFICTSTPDFVIIDAVYLKHDNDPSNWGMRAYEGPDFNGLNKDLQKAFYKYLGLRGISSYVNDLHEYMLYKGCSEWRHLLRSMRRFVEK